MADRSEIPFPPLNAVQSTEVDYLTLFDIAQGGFEPPYAQYVFGEGRKVFMSNMQSDGVYDKPVTIVGGQTIHLPDPDLISTQD
jgi:hypothetical protein